MNWSGQHVERSTGSVVDEAGFELNGIPALSPDTMEFVRRHPSDARLAVAVALEAAAAQSAVRVSGAAPK